MSLTRHLTKHAVQALSPHVRLPTYSAYARAKRVILQYAPRTLSLHRLASRLANRLYGTFDILIPELNAGPVLWRVVQQCFSGTRTFAYCHDAFRISDVNFLAMLYLLTKRLGYVLSLPLSLHHSLAPSLSSIKRGDMECQKYDNVPVEIALAATALVVLKLVYGLDGKKR
jgi:RNA polymerase I-specific transcription initiation factor RRN7